MLYDHTFFKCYAKVAPKFRVQILGSYYAFKLVKNIIVTLLEIFLAIYDRFVIKLLMVMKLHQCCHLVFHSIDPLGCSVLLIITCFHTPTWHHVLHPPPHPTSLLVYLTLLPLPEQLYIIQGIIGNVALV